MKSKIVVLAIILGIINTTSALASSADVEVKRIEGSNRIETSVEISNQVYDKSDVVILASTSGEVDALSGSILAEHKKAPILLTSPSNLSPSVLNKIQDLDAKTVYLLGGDSVISSSVEKALSTNYNVIRLAGSNRAETAIKIANEVPNKSNEVFLAAGFTSLADALSIGPISATNKTPILLTNRDSIPKATLNEIVNSKPKKITVIGGDSAISQQVLNQLPKGVEIERISGTDRFDTSVKIAQKYNQDADKVILANGYTLADALSGGYMASKFNMPILLSNPEKATVEVQDYIDTKVNQVIILGGQSAIGDNVLNNSPISKPPIVKWPDTKEELQSQIKLKLKGMPEEISVKYTGEGVESRQDAVSQLYEAIDSGSYETGNIRRYYTYFDKEGVLSNITFKLEYRTTSEEEDFIDKEINKIIVQNIEPSMDDFTKVKVIHDYLVNNTTYSSDTVNNRYTAYALFKENKGVCNAYALSFSRIMDKLNIDNIYVKGDASGEGESGTWGLHAWNKVKVGNHWYNIDTTWDFPKSEYGLHNAYYNFMNSDARFYKTHKPANIKGLPVSNDNKYDGMYDNNFSRN